MAVSLRRGKHAAKGWSQKAALYAEESKEDEGFADHSTSTDSSMYGESPDHTGEGAGVGVPGPGAAAEGSKWACWGAPASAQVPWLRGEESGPCSEELKS